MRQLTKAEACRELAVSLSTLDRGSPRGKSRSDGSSTEAGTGYT